MGVLIVGMPYLPRPVVWSPGTLDPPLGLRPWLRVARVRAKASVRSKAYVSAKAWVRVSANARDRAKAWVGAPAVVAAKAWVRS